MWDRVTAIARTGIDWLTDAWNDAWNTVKTTVSNAANAIVATVTGWRDRLIGIFSNAISWLLQAGRNVIQGLWNGLKAVWDQVAGWLRLMPSNFKLFFTGALSWLLEGGKNIIRGLLQGIKAIWTNIIDWFKDVPGKILGALGISSPPKWAIEAGKLIMEGVNKGIGWGAGKAMDFLGKYRQQIHRRPQRRLGFGLRVDHRVLVR